MKTHSTARLTFGLGLRKPHYQDFLAGDGPDAVVPVDFVEVISENFMVPGGRPRDILRRVRARHAVALHGVSLSLGAAQGVDLDYLRTLRQLVDEIEPFIVSDHLCWTGTAGFNSHDLLPLPYTHEALAVACANIGRAQDILGRSLVVENPSSYLQFSPADWSEWDFIAELAARTGCALLLDLNNVHVSATNHGFSVVDYLAGIPMARVRQIHLAGHSQGRELLIDTHDQPVADPVWALLAHVAPALEDVAVMIERDDAIPPLPELLAELDHARALCHQPARVETRQWA